MSLKIKNLLILLTLLSIASSKWNVKIVSVDGGEEVEYLTVNKGFYSTYNFRITADDSENPKKKSIVTLKLDEDSSFKLSTPITINSMIESSFPFSVGIACTSQLKAGDYKVKIIAEGDVDEFIMDSEVLIRLGEEKQVVELYKNIETIPEGEFGLVTIKNSFNNFHDFTVEFTYAGQDQVSEIENMNLEAYSETRGPLTTKYFKFKANKVNKTSEESYTFAIQDGKMQQCLSIEDNTFSFNTEIKDIPVLSEYREQIVNSLEYIKSFSFDVNFKFKQFPVYPVIMRCIIQSYSYSPELLTADEIRKLENSNEKLAIFNQYITSEGDASVHIPRASRNEIFRGKCVFDTPTNEEEDFNSIEITFGDFPGADYKKPLLGPKPSEFKPICAFWQFENYVNVDSFVNKFIDVSDEKLIESQTLAYDKGGCLSTKRVNMGQDKSKVQICIVSEEECYFNPELDFSKTFFELSNSVNTAEKIRAEFGFENFNVKEFREINFSGIDTSNVGSKLIERNAKTALITFENKDKYDYTCYSKSAKPGDEMSLFFFDFSNEEKMVFKAKKQVDYSVDLKDIIEEENDDFSVYLVCYRSDFDYIKKGISSPFKVYPPSKDDKKSHKTVIIIVCVVGALVVAVGLFFLIKYLSRKNDEVSEKMKKANPLITDDVPKDETPKEEV